MKGEYSDEDEFSKSPTAVLIQSRGEMLGLDGKQEEAMEKDKMIGAMKGIKEDRQRKCEIGTRKGEKKKENVRTFQLARKNSYLGLVLPI